MENTKKIKLFIGLSYLLIVCLFLYFFFSKFSLSEITSYDFLRDNQSYFFELKKSNLFLISINYFLKQLIREKFLNKFQNLEIKFKQSEFIYLLIYRFIGGIPWQLSCLLPTLFNVKVINFFFATLIGIIPQIFLAVSIGSGLEKIIDQNAKVPGITDIIFSPDIYVPLTAFFILILITIFLRKFFYRN